MSSILFGNAMVPIFEQDSILFWGYSILYKEYKLTGFNHQKNATHMGSSQNEGPLLLIDYIAGPNI